MIVFVKENSIDHDEMLHTLAFHLGLEYALFETQWSHEEGTLSAA